MTRLLGLQTSMNDADAHSYSETIKTAMNSNPTLRGISSMATRLLLAELAKAWHQKHGDQVAIESVGGVDAAKRVTSGEPFDLVVLASDAIDKLVAAGHVVADSRTDLVRSTVAVAVRRGDLRPDIGSEDALRAAVLSARNIGYSTGPSGTELLKLFERWGISDSVKNRVVQAPPGVPVAQLIAEGKVALGFQQLSEMMNAPGVDILGGMPNGCAITSIFTAGLCQTSRHAAAVSEFIDFMNSPASAEIKRHHGMEPA